MTFFLSAGIKLTGRPRIAFKKSEGDRLSLVVASLAGDESFEPLMYSSSPFIESYI